MNTTKFAITDDNFLPRMIEKCRDEKERGMVYILYYTGIHGSKLQTLRPENLIREGDKHYLRWSRTKTGRTLEALIPDDKLPTVRTYLALERKNSLRWNNSLLRAIGTRAGYDNVSTMTFRHTRAVRLILDGTPLPVVADLLGCTEEIITRAYGRLTKEQLRGQMR